LFIFLLVQTFFTHALPTDSLVRLSEITYTSAFERQVFDDYFQHHKKDYLALFMAVSKETGNTGFVQSRQQYQEVLEQLNTSDLQKKMKQKDKSHLQPDA
jgi:hypothetical protein